MIELNCTYEESKKILELGYDFSNICWIFRQETPSFKMGLAKIEDDFLAYTTPEGESFDDQIHRSYSSIEDVLKLGYVPIIPKAALEDCLPDYTRYGSDFTWAGHTSISLKYGTGEDLTIENYTTEHISAFEAFIWCHEKYPEELKAKFNEVMG